jgi:membrane fusion protein, multidrug efflux system
MAQYEQATSDVFASRSKYLASRDAFERMHQASQQEGTVAGGELERFRNQMMADSAALQSARAHQSVLANLKEYLIIRAPFSGIITERKVDPGALVGANNSSPLFTIENSRQLRLRIPVPEAYSAALPADKKLQFSVDALPGETYSATLSRQAGAINLENRTETWEFVAENSNGKLKSGMYLTARLQLARNGKSFVVPTTSVATTLEKKFVIALHKGKTEWIDVRQGASINSRNEIFGMLKEGDTLLLRANDEIKPNTSLKAKIVAIQ